MPRAKNEKNPIFSLGCFFLDAWPAFAVLLGVFFIAVFVAEFTFLSGIKSLWKVLSRFFRLSFILILPILVIPYICMITLFKDSDRYLAIWNVLQMSLVLYSPFVMLAVAHFLYIRRKEAVLIKRLNVLKQPPPVVRPREEAN